MASAIYDPDTTPSCIDNLSTPHCIPISSVPNGAPPQIPPPSLSSFNTSPFINHNAFLVFPAAEIQCSTPPTVILTTPL
ncbi:hypothetical protein Peur_072988 [Populus x canadensis]